MLTHPPVNDTSSLKVIVLKSFEKATISGVPLGGKVYPQESYSIDFRPARYAL